MSYAGRFPPRIARAGAAAAVLSALLLGGTVTATPAAAAVGSVCYGDLPAPKGRARAGGRWPKVHGGAT